MKEPNQLVQQKINLPDEVIHHTPDSIIPAPVIKRLAVSSIKGSDQAPISMDIANGTGTIVVNETRFEDIFHSLEPKLGRYKGMPVTPEVLAEAIKEGKVLLEKDDLFEKGVAERYADYQSNVSSRLVNLIEKKAKEIRDPVNQLRDVLIQIPKGVLGELPEIHKKINARNRLYKVELEKREREAALKDTELRTATAGQLAMLSQLPSSMKGLDPDRIKEKIDELEQSVFEPHQEFVDQYADLLAATIESLQDKYEAAVVREKEVKEKEAKEKAEQEKRDAELKKLQEEKAKRAEEDAAREKAEAKERVEREQERKALETTTKIATLYADAVGSNSLEDLAKAVADIGALILQQDTNPFFDKGKAEETLDKVGLAIYQAEGVKLEAVKKAEADKAAQEEALINSNKAILTDAGFVLSEHDGLIGYWIPGSEDLMKQPVTFVAGLSIISKGQLQSRIADYTLKLENAQKEKADKLAQEEADREKVRQRAEANYAAAVKAMSKVILNLPSHEAIIESILNGGIPHVRFDAAPAEEVSTAE